MGVTNYVAFESIIMSYILYGMLPIGNNYNNNLSLEYLVLEYVTEFSN